MNAHSVQDLADEICKRMAARGKLWDPEKRRRVAEEIHGRLSAAGGKGQWRVNSHPTQPLDPTDRSGPRYEVVRKDSDPLYWSEGRADSQVVADALNSLSL